MLKNLSQGLEREKNQIFDKNYFSFFTPGTQYLITVENNVLLHVSDTTDFLEIHWCNKDM